MISMFHSKKEELNQAQKEYNQCARMVLWNATQKGLKIKTSNLKKCIKYRITFEVDSNLIIHLNKIDCENDAG